MAMQNFRNRQSVFHNKISVFPWLSKKVVKVFVFWLKMIILFFPLRNDRAIPYKEIKIRIYKDSYFRFERLEFADNREGLLTIKII